MTLDSFEKARDIVIKIQSLDNAINELKNIMRNDTSKWILEVRAGNSFSARHIEHYGCCPKCYRRYCQNTSANARSWWMNWRNYNAERFVVMKDLTERKLVYLDDAIDAVNEYFARIGKLKRRGLTIEEKAIHLDTVDAIKALPSAQPERKTGKWLTSDDFYETGICSRCKWDSQEPISYAVTNFNFCPNCGARMVQEGEDNDS